MRLRIPWLPALLSAALALGPIACSDEDEEPEQILLESSELVEESIEVGRAEEETCQVQGTIFNLSRTQTCDAPLTFLAFDEGNTVIGEASTVVENLPPQTRSAYSATFRDRRDNDFLLCEEVVTYQFQTAEARCDGE